MKDIYFKIKRGIEKVCNIYKSVGEALYSDPRERLILEIMSIIKEDTDHLTNKIRYLETENERLKALFEKETVVDRSETENNVKELTDSSTLDGVDWCSLKMSSFCKDCGGDGAFYVSKNGYKLCWNCIMREGEFNIVVG